MLISLNQQLTFIRFICGNGRRKQLTMLAHSIIMDAIALATIDNVVECRADKFEIYRPINRVNSVAFPQSICKHSISIWYAHFHSSCIARGIQV